MKKTNYSIIQVLGSIIALGLMSFSVQAAANTLKNITYSTLPGDQVQIRLTLSEPATVPGSFTIDNPARIAFDLSNTNVDMASKSRNIGVGYARSISAVEAAGRTRVVLNLTKLINYQTTVEGNDVVITLNTGANADKPKGTGAQLSSLSKSISENIQNIDFRRGEKGEGRIIMTLADPNTAIDMKKRGKDVIVTVKNSSVGSNLQRRLDVLDFATLVKTVDTFNHGNDVRMIISATADFDHIAYQTENTFTIDVKPITKIKKSIQKKKEFKGERLSLNFQNIDIRAVLQLIADFTGKNLITSDSVEGNLTLRLKNVPWDQALDIILKTKGLGMQEQGNVISIAPLEEIAARNKVTTTIEDNSPLVSESIQINYAKASDLASLIKSKDNSLLSSRGKISVDERTNKLLVKDTARNLDTITALVQELDIPVKQVLIESRVVLAIDDFSNELGVRFGVSRNYVRNGTDQATTSGDLFATNEILNGDPLTAPGRWNVDLPATSSTAGTIGLALAKLPFGTLLELELSAAQTEGRSETIASPRVITANQKKAVIESGTEIPYEEKSTSGDTTIAFKKAVLSLAVTPQITPDDRVIMDLEVHKDEPDYANITAGVPPILTQNVKTQVLVDNGETIVLGGVYEQSTSNQVNRVPFFSDLPIVGALFRNKLETDQKSELLIFVTPKLIKENVSL